MVMVWLEGGQGEVKGACAPPPPPNTPNCPTWTPPHHHPELPHLDPPPQPTLPEAPTPAPPIPPPHSPSLNAPPPMPPPPKGASGQQLVGGVVGVQNRGVAPPWPQQPTTRNGSSPNSIVAGDVVLLPVLLWLLPKFCNRSVATVALPPKPSSRQFLTLFSFRLFSRSHCASFFFF